MVPRSNRRVVSAQPWARGRARRMVRSHWSCQMLRRHHRLLPRMRFPSMCLARRLRRRRFLGRLLRSLLRRRRRHRHLHQRGGGSAVVARRIALLTRRYFSDVDLSLRMQWNSTMV